MSDLERPEQVPQSAAKMAKLGAYLRDEREGG